MAHPPRPFVGLFAGIAAGLVASAAMSAFETIAADVLDGPGGDAVADEEPTPSGLTSRFVIGAVMGAIYGVLAEYRPEASTGFGSAYGVAASALLPAIDSNPPEEAPAEPQAFGVAAHLLYGVVLEGMRWLIAGRR